MIYFVKTPWLLKKYYPGCIWNIPGAEKKIYLSFDDGPHPVATPFVLDELKKYNAKATFFCIGKNVADHGDIYRRILDEGHRTGNHTNNHLNGWKVTDDEYFKNILEATKYIDSNLFRPPYGKISRFQSAALTQSKNNFKIIMWDVLSGDFDQHLSTEKCESNVLKNTREGSIVVFHDSEKAFEKLEKVLPKMLNYFSKLDYQFEAIR